MRTMPPIHPGEQLREEFMRPRGITPERLAEDIGAASWEVAEVVEERCAVSSELALRLARYFGTTARFWLDMQRDHDLAKTVAALGDRLDLEVKNIVGFPHYDGADRRVRPRLG